MSMYPHPSKIKPNLKFGIAHTDNHTVYKYNELPPS